MYDVIMSQNWERPGEEGQVSEALLLQLLPTCQIVAPEKFVSQ